VKKAAITPKTRNYRCFLVVFVLVGAIIPSKIESF